MRRLGDLSIHNRLLLVALLPAALLATLITGLVLYRSMATLDEALRERGQAIVSFLAPAAEYGVISANRANLSELLRAALAQREVSAVAIYNREGTLLASTGRFNVLEPTALQEIDRPSISRGPVNVFVATAPVVSRGVDFDDVFRSSISDDEPPPVRTIGWVYVELDKGPSQREKRLVIFATLGLALVGLGLTGIVGLRLARSISRPIAALVEGVDRMAAGALDVELAETASTAELGALERGFNTMARSISESHRTMQSRIDAATALLAHQAQHDPLTGLPNRRAFEERLEESVAASKRAGDHGALCFIDLDRFKIVNDTCGHAAGDELLCRIARLIRQRVRDQDVVCRVGGDEFALILRGCSRTDALRIAEHLREGVAAFRFSWEDRLFSIGASIGVTYIDGTHATVADLLMAADSACYEAKKNGRNQVVEFTPQADRRPAAPGSVPGVDEGFEERIELHAQSIVQLDSGSDEAGWLEVLLRVRDTAGDLRQPAEYLAHFENGDAPVDLDIGVVELACGALAQLDSSGLGLPAGVSLNVGRASILQASVFLAHLRASLQGNGIPPERIVCELPVHFVDQFPDECRNFALGARELGCRLMLQQLDGGGVRHLRSLQPDYVKISLDALIAAYGLEAGCNLAQALAGMAAALDVTPIASEVEDPVLLETLQAFGFVYAQGHAIASPGPIGDWKPPDRAPSPIPRRTVS
ncbi:MAG: diguanylate cyclase [Aromatoleum sp.]|uniref:diguanylate cyclase n=1 Tax=Aromatoleum sp. TaxID=2307007 RepID=UPI002894274E|nr:diguanylate cyclase [Aromatoleum sp.]MDT3671195.1 diguanylate cyclase [Aromatoleum sp.]